MTIIEIQWSGPFSVNEISSFNSGEDYGLYQIYGIHNILGPETLLYIGQAKDQTFAVRIPQHDDWIGWDFPEYKIYLGRFGSHLENRNPDNWDTQINISENLLINFCAPPWNTQYINKIRDDIDDETIVINWGKRYKLPMEVSTLWKKSKYNDSNLWKLFTTE